MDAAAIAALRERAQRPFRIDAEVGPRKFKLVYPSPFMEGRIQTAVVEKLGRGNAAATQVLRDMVLASIVGWEGVTYHDLLGDNDDSTLEFSPEIAALLLDYNMEILDGLVVKIHEWREQRKLMEEQTLGNSESASTGS